MSSTWSPWRDLPLAGPPPSSTVLAELLDGGQAFRWRREAGNAWHGQWAGNEARLRLTGEGACLNGPPRQRWPWRPVRALEALP